MMYRLQPQDVSNTSVIASVSATFPSITMAGDLLLAVVHSNVAVGANTISGWTRLVDQDINSGAGSISLFYKLASGSETTITMSAAGATSVELQIYEYTGNANPIQTDGTAGGDWGGPGTGISTSSITTSNANDLIFTGGVDEGGGTRSWTTATLLLSFGMNLSGGQNIVSSTQSGYTDTFHSTSSGIMATVIAAFKAAPVVINQEFLMYNRVGM